MTTPDTPSDAYRYMFPKWQRTNAVLGGLDTMRAAGESLLPRHAGEKTYKERLMMTRLVNWTEITLDSLVGRPFSDPVTHEGLPESLTNLFGDVDLLGNDLDTFLRKWFRDGLAKGYSHVLVEFPRVEERENRTLLDDIDMRPYLCHIAPENLLYANAEYVNGREVLTEVRIREWRTERYGFEQVAHEQIRIITPGHVAIWEKEKEDKDDSWFVTSEYDYDLDFIPLVTYYANREGFMESKPPILDLVDLNIAHWQSTSEQVNVLTVARFPILAGSGIQDSDATIISPRVMLVASDSSARYYYVEHSGAAIAAGAKDLETLEQQMSGYGSQFLRKRPNRESATARAMDSAESSTPLMDHVARFTSAVEQALYYMTVWQGEAFDTNNTITIASDMGPEDAIDVDLNTLNAARANRDLSQKTYLAEIQRRGVLADGFDYDEERRRLEQESIDPLPATDMEL